MKEEAAEKHNAIREHIKSVRLAKKLSYRKLAAMADTDPNQIEEFENNKRDIRSLTLIKILLALNIDIFHIKEKGD